MNTCDPIEDHARVYQQSREKIEVAYLKAKSKRIENPVVLVLHLHDSLARQIVAPTGREADVEEQVRLADERGIEPIVLWHIPNEFAKRINYGMANVAEALNCDVGPEAFHTVIVAQEWVSVITTPAV